MSPVIYQEPQVYNVYKTNKDSLEYYKKESYYDDGIGPIVVESEWDTRPFQSDFYWINEYPEKSLYFSNNYMPVGPSGKINLNYGHLYRKSLRNLEVIGIWQNGEFSFHIPYLYTSIYELNPLDVFEFEEDHFDIFDFPKNKKYVFESYDVFKNLNFISDFDDSKEYKLKLDTKVKIVGRMINTRIYEPIKT